MRSAIDTHELDDSVQHSYLIVRLPWCHINSDEVNPGVQPKTSCRFNSAVCWLGGKCPSYKFALQTPCLLNKALLIRLARSFAVIEVWAKFTAGSPDRLIGLVKLRTAVVANTFAQVDTQRQRVSMQLPAVLNTLLTCTQPAIVLNSWMPITDPYSGADRGQLRVRLAIGTRQQIACLQAADGRQSSAVNMDRFETVLKKETSGWQALDVIQWPQNSSSSTEDCYEIHYVEHCLTVAIETLRDFDAHLALRTDNQLSGSVPWGDCDCFIQYYFPTGTQPESLTRHRTPVQLLIAPSLETLTGECQPQHHLVSCTFATATSRSSNGGSTSPSHWTQTHRLCFRFRHRSSSETTFGMTNPNRTFFHWLLEVLHPHKATDDHSKPLNGLPLELWLRIYSPNLRDCLVGRGWVTEDILGGLINLGSEGLDQTECQKRCSIRLQDIHSGRPNGLIDLCLTYSSRPVKPPLVGGTVELTGRAFQTENDPSIELPLQNTELVPNVSQPGVRLRVELHRIVGLVAALSPCKISRGFDGHIRLHCLLIPDSPQSGCQPIHTLKRILLGSAASANLHNVLQADHLCTVLEVLLPIGWRALPTSSTMKPLCDLTLVELLLNGEQTLNAQFNGYGIAQWSLMLQVDLWQQHSITRSSVDLQHDSQLLNANVGWDVLHESELTDSLIPGPGFKLLASTRVSLGQLIFSNRASMSSRWFPLCRFHQPMTTGTPDVNTLQAYFAGGVELSAQLLHGVQTKRRLLRHIVQTYGRDTQIVRCLRSWNISLPVVSTVNEDGDGVSSVELDDEPCLWHNGIDEQGFTYKHLILHLDAAKLPSTESLLTDSDPITPSTCELDCAWQNAQLQHFTGYAFVRFQFYRHGTQTSRLVPLPCGFGRCRAGVVQFADRKEYTVQVSAEFREYLTETELELQVWGLWTNRISPPTDNNCSPADEHEPHKSATSRAERSRIMLQPNPPSPRFIGLTRIPLSHLLHQPTRSSEEVANCVDPDGIELRTTASVHGDPSGIKWWGSGIQSTATGSQHAYPVFPLYKPGASDLLDSWISARVELRSSRSQFLTGVSLHTEPMDYSPDGHLGWNLDKAAGLTMKHFGSCVKGLSRDDDDETKFPAEVIVQQAYHLKPTGENVWNTTEREREATTTPEDGYVFVTFPVDGDRTGTLSAFDGLWARIVQARNCRAPHGRVAVTTRARSGSSVCWNYHRFVRLPLWLVQTATRRALVFHVWFQKDVELGPTTSGVTDTCETNPLVDQLSVEPELIGIASVDLTSLSSLFTPTAPQGYHDTNGAGLDQIYGWYNVVNSSGLECGQILLGVKPLVPGVQSTLQRSSHHASLEVFDLGLDKITGNNPSGLSVDPCTTRLSPLSNMRQLLSACPLKSALPHLNQSLQNLSTITEAAGSLSGPIAAGGTELSRSSLFDNLRAQLCELDAINNRFKQRLAGTVIDRSANPKLTSDASVMEQESRNTRFEHPQIVVQSCDSSKIGSPKRTADATAPRQQNNGSEKEGKGRAGTLETGVSLEPDRKSNRCMAHRNQLSNSALSDVTSMEPKDEAIRRSTQDDPICLNDQPSIYVHSSNEQPEVPTLDLSAGSDDDYRYPNAENVAEDLRLSDQHLVAGHECWPQLTPQSHDVPIVPHIHRHSNASLTINMMADDEPTTSGSDCETYEVSPLSVRQDCSTQPQHTLPIVQLDQLSVCSDRSASLTVGPASQSDYNDNRHSIEEEDDRSDADDLFGDSDNSDGSEWVASEKSSGQMNTDRDASLYSFQQKQPGISEAGQVASNPETSVGSTVVRDMEPVCPMDIYTAKSPVDFSEHHNTIPRVNRLSCGNTRPSSTDLLPSFFPPTSTFSALVKGRKSSPESFLQPNTDDQILRLKQLRAGLLNDPRDSPTESSDDNGFEALSRRLDSRITEAMRMVNQALDTPAGASTFSDPLDAVLAGHRTRRLQLAERVFSMTNK
ncbi:hypothetical protein EG68_09103 [Paragonimus skrjabini miyazakii]|uniref:C2 domain-containing protein 3 n=1 Tax=Paragonimus skrjabini miyazakii TaxID=59628 RepID=A0A8S9YA08_9TREM|nr:hypothetical protein EG68_09103 [Paragonimus skrjabini miyazakii]